MSKPMTWSEILDRLLALDERLKRLEAGNPPPAGHKELTDAELVKLWRETDRDPIKFALKLGKLNG